MKKVIEGWACDSRVEEFAKVESQFRQKAPSSLCSNRTKEESECLWTEKSHRHLKCQKVRLTLETIEETP